MILDRYFHYLLFYAMFLPWETFGVLIPCLLLGKKNHSNNIKNKA